LLQLTDASIFQMLRGSVVVFTAIFSVVFLKRKQYPFHWTGVVLVLAGAAIVGTQSYVCGAGSTTSTANSRAMIGNGLIIMAQVIVAVQMGAWWFVGGRLLQLGFVVTAAIRMRRLISTPAHPLCTTSLHDSPSQWWRRSS
jgi:drug/metabolite transporter (DMT)-like permease